MRTSLQFGDARACSVRAASYHQVQACEYLQITSNYKCLLQRHVGGFNSGEGAGSFLDISIPNEPSGCVYLSLYGDIQPKIPCYHLIDQHRTCLFQELQRSFDSFLALHVLQGPNLAMFLSLHQSLRSLFRFWFERTCLNRTCASSSCQTVMTSPSSQVGLPSRIEPRLD